MACQQHKQETIDFQSPQYQWVNAVLQISEDDIGLNDSNNQFDFDIISIDQQLYDSESNVKGSDLEENQGIQNQQSTYKNEHSCEYYGQVKEIQFQYDKDLTPRQIGEKIMLYGIQRLSLLSNEERKSKIKVLCKQNENEQILRIEMGEVIYDPIKSQIYITYAKGNPERTRPERKRKMIQKIVNPKNK